MFDTPAIAEQSLRERFPAAQVEIIRNALIPTILFRKDSAQKPASGQTRLGGAPDLAATLEWPRLAEPANADAIAARLNAEAGAELRDHLRLGLPYAFVGQIDLQEAAKLGSVAADLPQSGRLLFYYDFLLGPADTGSLAVRVLWDETLAANLRPAAMPPDLEKAHRDRLAFETQLAKQYDLPAPGADAGTIFWTPPAPMALNLSYRPPDRATLEMDAHPALAGLLRDGNDDGAFEAEYSDLFEQAFDPYYNAANSLNRVQLLGSPLPEQDDPRYEAVVATEYGKQYLSSEEWEANRAAIRAKAQEWRLLLQIDNSAWQGRRTEGTVYFLIRGDDLRARRFDRVVAVYQQT